MHTAVRARDAEHRPESPPQKPSTAHSVLRLLRPHQWLKNLLVLLPVALAHQWINYGVVKNALLATLCFCATASVVYIVNDLLDVEADRRHPRKKLRPLAAGTISTKTALAIAALLLAVVVVLAMQLPLAFGITLAIYFVVSNLYSLYLKTKVILDICVLAGLYTIRLFAGGAATHIRISQWTLAFAMFCFLGLAAVKRYTELLALPDQPTGLFRRGYQGVDKTTVQAMGVSSMALSVLVLALYLQSPEVTVLYRRPEALWLICPVLLYWFGRIWIVAGRGVMHSDPIVFAVRDRTSLLVAAVIIAIGLACK
jgi:4-hydroxybenzoate polyprenyltransferase